MLEGQNGLVARTAYGIMICLAICIFVVIGQAPIAAQTVESFGSGFVVHHGGWILTCNHVIRGCREIRVILEGNSYPALIVKTDANKDLALLKVANVDFQPLYLAEQVSPMEPIFAFGFPLGQKDLDGIDGTIRGVEYMETDEFGALNTVRFDASVNPGNSGGPLVNSFGEVVGVVNSKIVGAADMAFATHVQYLRPFVEGEVHLERPPHDSTVGPSGVELYRRARRSVCQIVARDCRGGDDEKDGDDENWTCNSSEEGAAELGRLLSKTYDDIIFKTASGGILLVSMTAGGDTKTMRIIPNAMNDPSFCWIYVDLWWTVKDEYKKQKGDTVVVSESVLRYANGLNKNSTLCGFYIDKDGDLVVHGNITFIGSIPLREIHDGLVSVYRYGTLYMLSDENSPQTERYMK